MKNKKLVVIMITLVAVLGISVFLYPKLKEQYERNNSPSEAQKSETVDSSATETQAVQNEAAQETVPDFTVLDMDGNTVSLSDYFGKPIVLNFWATWCGPCKSELPAFDSAYAEYSDEITFLMVNLTDGVQDTVDGTKSFAEKNGYTFPIYFDTEYSAATAYGVRSIPMTVFVQADGSLLDYSIGAISEDTLAGYIALLTSK